MTTTAPRDFSTISPSARLLLALRAATTLPYARAAALRLLGADGLAEEEARLAALPGTSLRRFHHEQRFRSIDTLLTHVGAKAVVELAGGLSFRGLALVEREAVTFVDTDLPEMIETKRALIAELGTAPRVGELRLEALDATDAAALRATVDTLPPGPVAVVNEGLLMYLDVDEKRRLATSIRAALTSRPGSAWITADIYFRVPHDPRIFRDPKVVAFLAQHNVEANKFADAAEAEALFTSAGLAIREKLVPPHDVTRESWMLVPA